MYKFLKSCFETDKHTETDKYTVFDHVPFMVTVACMAPHVIVLYQNASSKEYHQKNDALLSLGGYVGEILHIVESGGTWRKVLQMASSSDVSTLKSKKKHRFSQMNAIVNLEVWHEVTARQLCMGVMIISQIPVTELLETERALSRLDEAHFDMLINIYPRHVIEFISLFGMNAVPAAMAQLTHHHNDVSILFMDIVGFTPMSNNAEPREVMEMLNEMFKAFDGMCEIYNVYKVETVGDCYVAAAGLLEKDDDGFMQIAKYHNPVDSASSMIEFAKCALKHTKNVFQPHSEECVMVRIGIHTGPCVSGLIGNKMPKFSIFGDTMNTASRMESSCISGHIQVSGRTWDLLENEYKWCPTGGINIKGKGYMQTYIWEADIKDKTSPHQNKQLNPKKCSISEIMNSALLGAYNRRDEIQSTRNTKHHSFEKSSSRKHSMSLPLPNVNLSLDL